MNIKTITKKIALFYLSITIIILSILYPLLPYFLNYPPDSVNTPFQQEVDTLTYTQQYLLLVFIGIISSIILLFMFLFKINKNIKSLDTINVSEESFNKYINNIIQLCINTPLILYISEVIVPLVILPLALIITGAQPIVIMKISSIIILSLMLASVLCYIFSQKEFQDILVYIHEKYPEKLSNINDIKLSKLSFNLNSFSSKLLLKLVPLFLFSMIFILLCAYNYNTKLIANIYNETYNSLLHNTLDDKNFNSSIELIDALNTIELSNNSHTRFVISDINNYYTSDNSNLSTFFQKYTLDLSEQNNNRTYDYYCIDNFGSTIPIDIHGTTYYAGIKYSSGSIDFFIVIFSIFAVLLIIMCIMITYISHYISKRLCHISNGFHMMQNSLLSKKQLAVTSSDEIGVLVSEFNIIQTINDNYITQIQNNQDMLLEKERLASLGQLIGGISHNLKTPIMSISGAAEGLTDLIDEYDASVGDPEVTAEDHHEIANDMRDWITKIHSYTAYMSDIITAVKGQAVNLSENEKEVFTIDELFKRVNILMKHEIKNASLILKVNLEIPESTSLEGDVNSLVQVVNNLITNAIQSYNGIKGQTIELTAKKQDTNLIISVLDHGCGMTDDVKEKLFKSMVTTKGKNGTGLGMFMSYSTIKGHFNGDITFESTLGKGTTFNLILPLPQS